MMKSRPKIIFSPSEQEFIDGALLGDGCISKPKGNSSQFTYTTSKKTHAEYVYSKLKRIAVNENKNGPILSHVFDNRTGKTYHSYRFRTVNNIAFKEIYDKWYPEKKKSIPPDIKLTPLSVLIWYIGDGGIINGKRCQHIKISTHAFDKHQLETGLLPQLRAFDPHLVKVKKEQYYIYIPRRKMKDFFTFIGKCPVKEYRYKWNIIPYIYKNIRINGGPANYSAKYSEILKEWNSNEYTIYQLSKRFKVPVRCIKNKLTSNNIKWIPIDVKKHIIQCDLFANPIKTWCSGQQIKRELGYSVSSISMCCRGLRKCYKGYIWKFEKVKTPLALV